MLDEPVNANRQDTVEIEILINQIMDFVFTMNEDDRKGHTNGTKMEALMRFLPSSSKPSWSTNPFYMSFTDDLDSSHMPVAHEDRSTETKSSDAWNAYPEWLGHFMTMEGIYKNSYCCDLVSDATLRDAFAKEIEERLSPFTNLQEQTATGPALKVSSLRAHLFYDLGLRQWQITYDFRLTTSTGMLSQMIGSSIEAPAREDMLNAIRDAFAVSDGREDVADTVRSIQAEAQRKAQRIIERLYDAKLSGHDCDITVFPDSCTNVTIFYLSSAIKSLKPEIEQLNNVAERKRDNVIALLSSCECSNDATPTSQGDPATSMTGPRYDGVELFTFGGRFNSVILDSSSASVGAGQDHGTIDAYVAQFAPILFHTHLMWGYLTNMTDVMQDIERSMLERSTKRIESKIRFFNSLINSIEFASFENETFKRGAEQDSECIYEPIETKWNIQSSLSQMKDFTSYLSEYLDRDYQDHVLRSDRKQNVVLFIIALLGIFGLISVWDDYLDIVTGGGTFHEALESSLIGSLFPTVEALTLFSIWLPAITVFLCLLAIICMYIWRPKK